MAMTARPSHPASSAGWDPGAAGRKVQCAALTRGDFSPPISPPRPPLRGVRSDCRHARRCGVAVFFLRSGGRRSADVTRPPKKPGFARRTPWGGYRVALAALWAAAGSCPQRQTHRLAALRLTGATGREVAGCALGGGARPAHITTPAVPSGWSCGLHALRHSCHLHHTAPTARGFAGSRLHSCQPCAAPCSTRTARAGSGMVATACHSLHTPAPWLGPVFGGRLGFAPPARSRWPPLPPPPDSGAPGVGGWFPPTPLASGGHVRGHAGPAILLARTAGRLRGFTCSGRPGRHCTHARQPWRPQAAASVDSPRAGIAPQTPPPGGLPLRLRPRCARSEGVTRLLRRRPPPTKEKEPKRKGWAASQGRPAQPFN